jgi:hypothetical protein
LSNSCHYSENGRCSGQFVLAEPLNQSNRRHKLRLRTVSELFPEVIEAELDGDGLRSTIPGDKRPARWIRMLTSLRWKNAVSPSESSPR